MNFMSSDGVYAEGVVIGWYSDLVHVEDKDGRVWMGHPGDVRFIKDQQSASTP